VVNDHPPLDPLISTNSRLSIMAALAAVAEMEFSAVRDIAGVRDSVLSKQAAALEAAGYVEIRKGHAGRRPRTWLSLTEQGRAALRSHVGALRSVIAMASPEGE
jgi:DNA-binding MarR family transcriptional regulator